MERSAVVQAHRLFHKERKVCVLPAAESLRIQAHVKDMILRRPEVERVLWFGHFVEAEQLPHDDRAVFAAMDLCDARVLGGALALEEGV